MLVDLRCHASARHAIHRFLGGTDLGCKAVDGPLSFAAFELDVERYRGVSFDWHDRALQTVKLSREMGSN
jgi:hypothetical protein